MTAAGSKRITKQPGRPLTFLEDNGVGAPVNNSDALDARGRVSSQLRISALLKVGTPREDWRRSPAVAQPCRGLAEEARESDGRI
jgi:hypothetical protein